MVDPSKRGFQIAIDGPVASGKGVVSRLLAERMGWIYIDTGAMYRSATLVAERMGLDFEDLDEMNSGAVNSLVEAIRGARFEFERPSGEEDDGRLVTVKLDGEDVSGEIRGSEISEKTPIVAKIPEIREVLVEKQQEIAEEKDPSTTSTSSGQAGSGRGVVMEGRDIGSRVLPEADLKIYLDADLKVRVRRRWLQLREAGEDVSEEEVEGQVVARDEQDMEREFDPLTVDEGAWHLDTSKLTVREVIDVIERRVRGLTS